MFFVLFFVALFAGLIAINVLVESLWKKVIYSVAIFLLLDFCIGSIANYVSIPYSEHLIPFVHSEAFAPISLNPEYKAFDGTWGNHANEYSRITNSETCENTELLICCYGGSSTYCLGLEEKFSWPSQLETMLISDGYDVEVHNHGLPGHNLRDNLNNKQRYSCYGSSSQKVLEIHYHGWNDFRLVNVPNIQYENLDAALEWHERSTRMMVGLDEILPNTIAYNYYYMNFIGRQAALFINFLEHHTLFISAILLKAHGLMHENINVQRTHLRALHDNSSLHPSEAMMMAHLHTDIRELHDSGVHYLFIPQHLNFELVAQKGTSYAYWMPGITEQKAAAYCLALDDYCAQNLPIHNYLPLIPELWNNVHFLDYGHFSELGCGLFAEKIFEHLRTTTVLK